MASTFGNFCWRRTFPHGDGDDTPGAVRCGGDDTGPGAGRCHDNDAANGELISKLNVLNVKKMDSDMDMEYNVVLCLALYRNIGWKFP